jgi:hypothetical protein
MRVAVAILSLALMLLVGLQSCAISFGAALSEDDNLAGGGAVGILMALLLLLGGAFAVGYPLVSLISFAIAGLFGLAAGTTTEFEDLAIWATASFFLAVLSYLGIGEKRRQAAGRERRVE